MNIAQTETVSKTSTDPYLPAFSVVTSLFFIFGFITCLNDILIPHLKSLFSLNYAQAALIQFCFFSAYFFASIPAGKLVSRFGYKNGTVIGLLITACGCFLFYPAATSSSYPLFLSGLFILACGITLIQVAVNPYVAILGPSHLSSSRLALAQAFNSLGTTLAPIFGSILILSSQVTDASSVIGPYISLATTLVGLAIIMGLFNLPKFKTEEDTTDAKKFSVFSYRHLVLGAVGIFCYVGAEVAIGSYLVNFIGLKEIAGLSASDAAHYVSIYWGLAMVGRFIGSYLMRSVAPNRLLVFNSIGSVLLIAVAMTTKGSLAMYAILCVGLLNSIMFPTIFTLAIKDLGPYTAKGSGLLCMAIVGGAIIPLLQGLMADSMGLQPSYILPLICYLFIVYYGWKGYSKSLI
jgi:MFS transporter, FHS family, L-fucose permease